MIYDFDIDSNAVELLPPDKRANNSIAFIRGLLSPLQTARDTFFGTYYHNDLKYRINYNGQRIVLEYALNVKYGGVFRQPPLRGDIYITKLASVNVGFLIGATEPYCSTIGETEDYGNEFQITTQDAIGTGSEYLYSNNFSIMIPAALWAAIAGGQTDDTNNIISDFVNKYIPIGIKYTITVI